jgi:hypothetical protein
VKLLTGTRFDGLSVERGGRLRGYRLFPIKSAVYMISKQHNHFSKASCDAFKYILGTSNITSVLTLNHKTYFHYQPINSEFKDYISIFIARLTGADVAHLMLGTPLV